LLCRQPATHLQEFSLLFCFVLRCMHYAAFHIAVQTTCHAPARILSSVLFVFEVHYLVLIAAIAVLVAAITDPCPHSRSLKSLSS